MLESFYIKMCLFLYFQELNSISLGHMPGIPEDILTAYFHFGLGGSTC